MNEKNLYDYLIRLQAISKAGLLYSKDPYAISNYEEIQKLTLEMLENLQDVNLTRNNYFDRNVYPTPNISVRTIVFNENNEFLMVKEVRDGKYSFPGGWADLYDSPSESALREVMEEAGAEIVLEKIIGVLYHTPIKNPASIPGYVIFFKARFVQFLNHHDHEISEVGWFTRENLPPLSHTTTIAETSLILDAAFNDKFIFD